MKINNVTIYDTFAEAWDLEVVRVVLTAMTTELALGGAEQFAGAAGSSMIGSKINAGIERLASPQETPDGRPSVFVSLAMVPDARQDMLKELELRLALASLIPTIAIFDAAIDFEVIQGEIEKGCRDHPYIQDVHTGGYKTRPQ